MPKIIESTCYQVEFKTKSGLFWKRTVEANSLAEIENIIKEYCAQTHMIYDKVYNLERLVPMFKSSIKTITIEV